MVKLGALLISGAAAYEKEWAEFQAAQGVRNGEIPAAFKANVDFVKAHNSEESSYKLSYTGPFADKTEAEYGQRLMRKRSSAPQVPVARELQTVAVAAPTSLDWVAQGAVTPVKDQSNCGSCWAFGTTGAIEGAFQIASGKLVSLSEQNLVSCSFNGNAGCGGGEQSDALCWTYHNGGLCKEEDYPYISGDGKDGYACRKDCAQAVTVSGYFAVPKGDEDALLQAVLQQPVTIGIDAAADPFMLYDHGIIDAKCGHDLDHAVLIVGFGTGATNSEASKPYWRIKNSWNTDWGEEGYLRVVRGKNMCGVADGALYPVDARAPDASPTPAPPTQQCPKLPDPAPRLPPAYSVTVTQDWGNGSPISSMLAVDYDAQTMINTGYYVMAPEEKLYRCDLNPKAEFPGKSYYIDYNGTCVDGSDAEFPLSCPWSRWTDELMNGLVSAERNSSGQPCPKSPHGTSVSEAARCDSYITGKGTDFVTTFWLTSDGSVPVKELQVLKGKQGFTVTTYFSDYQVGKPASKVFNIPKGCPKAGNADIVV